MAKDPARGDVRREKELQRLIRDAPAVGGYPMAWVDPSCGERAVAATSNRAAAEA